MQPSDDLDEPSAEIKIPTTGELFGRAVQRYRKSANLSQRQLAEHMAAGGLKMDPTAITRIESGSRPVRIEEAVLLAAIFGVSVGELLGERSGGVADQIEAISVEAGEHLRVGCLEIALWLMKRAEVDRLIGQTKSAGNEELRQAIDSIASAVPREVVMVPQGTDVERLKVKLSEVRDSFRFFTGPPMDMTGMTDTWRYESTKRAGRTAVGGTAKSRLGLDVEVHEVRSDGEHPET